MTVPLFVVEWRLNDGCCCRIGANHAVATTAAAVDDVAVDAVAARSNVVRTLCATYVNVVR